jgi:hypothetical protein
MKQVIILALTLLVNSFAFSQDVDARLMKKYSQEELVTMKDQNPGHYKMLVYALDNACYIADLPKGKSDAVTGSVDLDMTKSFTFVDLGLDIKKENQYLRISGTNKMLVVKSEWVLNNELTTKK